MQMASSQIARLANILNRVSIAASTIAVIVTNVQVMLAMTGTIFPKKQQMNQLTQMTALKIPLKHLSVIATIKARCGK